jgi:hypothetical protein
VGFVARWLADTSRNLPFLLRAEVGPNSVISEGLETAAEVAAIKTHLCDLRHRILNARTDRGPPDLCSQVKVFNKKAEGVKQIGRSKRRVPLG